METIIVVSGPLQKAGLSLTRALSARTTQVVKLWQYRDTENLRQHIAGHTPNLMICMAPQDKDEDALLKELLEDLVEQEQRFPRIVLGEFDRFDRAIMGNNFTFVTNRPDKDVTFDEIAKWIQNPISSMQKCS